MTGPHFIDKPGARRCAQHARQRDLWVDAKSTRKRRGLGPKPWVPDPVAPEALQAAADYLSTQNARTALEAAAAVAEAGERLAAHARTMPAPVARPLKALADGLHQQADVLRELAHDLGADRRITQQRGP